MQGIGSSVGAVPLDSDIVRLALAVALGLFLGLEREWSQKPAGIRTFALISVLGAMFSMLDQAQCGSASVAVCQPLLSAVGAAFVTLLAGVLMYSGIGSEDESLNLTTAVSLLVAYGVGMLVSVGEVLLATVVTVASSLLLVFKRELHGFAWGLSREEMRSASEFAILAFVVYPLLPAESVTIIDGSLSVAIEPRVVWLMVVFVAGIGIVNYAVVQSYGGRGIAVTGFFGGLASSTAVVGTMLDHVRQRPDAASYAVAAILLADAAMALRNLLIALVFTAPEKLLVGAIAPLGVVVVGSIAVAAVTADWSQEIDLDLENPFSMRNALAFGGMFLVVIVAGSIAKTVFGNVGFYVTAALTGLVSSAGATTSAVVLYRTGQLDPAATTLSIMLATGSSIAVKAALTATSGERAFGRRVAVWSGALLAAAGFASVTALL